MSKTVQPLMDVWCVRSINKYFHELLSPTAHVHIEGFDATYANKPEWFEVRMDGPWYTEWTHGQYRAQTEINILCSVAQGVDRLRVRVLTGLVVSKFRFSIPVFRYGLETESDNTKIGCFELQKRAKHTIQTNFFGQVKPNTALQQASVEARYDMFFGV